MADFLNGTFNAFDSAIINAMHNLAVSAGGFFTPLFKAVTFIGEKGIIFFALALILMLFSKTRKLGVCIFGAVACGALITNLILKDIIARPRPFESVQFSEFWQFLKSPKEDGYSFPSGHVTAITAFATALFIISDKKWSWVGFVGVIIMGVARIYLIAHYPTDVIAGILVGLTSGVIAFYITKLIFHLLNKHSEKKFCNFLLNACILNLFKKK